MTICSPLDAITVYMFLGHYNRFIAHVVAFRLLSPHWLASSYTSESDVPTPTVPHLLT